MHPMLRRLFSFVLLLTSLLTWTVPSFSFQDRSSTLRPTETGNSTGLEQKLAKALHAGLEEWEVFSPTLSPLKFGVPFRDQKERSIVLLLDGQNQVWIDLILVDNQRVRLRFSAPDHIRIYRENIIPKGLPPETFENGHRPRNRAEWFEFLNSERFFRTSFFQRPVRRKPHSGNSGGLALTFQKNERIYLFDISSKKMVGWVELKSIVDFKANIFVTAPSPIKILMDRDYYQQRGRGNNAGLEEWTLQPVNLSPNNTFVLTGFGKGHRVEVTLLKSFSPARKSSIDPPQLQLRFNVWKGQKETPGDAVMVDSYSVDGWTKNKKKSNLVEDTRNGPIGWLSSALRTRKAYDYFSRHVAAEGRETNDPRLGRNRASFLNNSDKKWSFSPGGSALFLDATPTDDDSPPWRPFAAFSVEPQKNENDAVEFLLSLRPGIRVEKKASAAGLEESVAAPWIISMPTDQEPIFISGKGGGTTLQFQAGTVRGLIAGTEVSGPIVEPGDTQDQILDRMAGLIFQVIEKLGPGFDPNRIMYVHLSFPGYFNKDMVLMWDQENIPGMKKGLHIGRALEERLAQRITRLFQLGRIPVRVVHDGTGHALGDLSRFGTVPGARSLFFIAPGTGVATRLVEDGRPFTGGERVHELANEVPHTAISNGDPDNPDYRLVILEMGGNHPNFTSPTLSDGVTPNPLLGKEDLEDRTSGPAIGRYAIQMLQSGQFNGPVADEVRGALPGDIAAKVQENHVNEINAREWDDVTKTVGKLVTGKANPLAVKAFQDRGRELGIGLAVILVEFHKIWGKEFPFPEHILLAGGVSKIGPLYYLAVREGFQARLTRYAADASALLDGLSVNDLVGRFEPSTLPEDARELLGGLPTEEEAMDYAQRMTQAAGLEEEVVRRENVLPRIREIIARKKNIKRLKVLDRGIIPVEDLNESIGLGLPGLIGKIAQNSFPREGVVALSVNNGVIEINPFMKALRGVSYPHVLSLLERKEMNSEPEYEKVQSTGIPYAVFSPGSSDKPLFIGIGPDSFSKKIDLLRESGRGEWFRFNVTKDAEGLLRIILLPSYAGLEEGTALRRLLIIGREGDENLLKDLKTQFGAAQNELEITTAQYPADSRKVSDLLQSTSKPNAVVVAGTVALRDEESLGPLIKSLEELHIPVRYVSRADQERVDDTVRDLEENLAAGLEEGVPYDPNLTLKLLQPGSIIVMGSERFTVDKVDSTTGIVTASSSRIWGAQFSVRPRGDQYDLTKLRFIKPQQEEVEIVGFEQRKDGRYYSPDSLVRIEIFPSILGSDHAPRVLISLHRSDGGSVLVKDEIPLSHSSRRVLSIENQDSIGTYQYPTYEYHDINDLKHPLITKVQYDRAPHRTVTISSRFNNIQSLSHRFNVIDVRAPALGLQPVRVYRRVTVNIEKVTSGLEEKNEEWAQQRLRMLEEGDETARKIAAFNIQEEIHQAQSLASLFFVKNAQRLIDGLEANLPLDKQDERHYFRKVLLALDKDGRFPLAETVLKELGIENGIPGWPVSKSLEKATQDTPLTAGETYLRDPATGRIYLLHEVNDDQITLALPGGISTLTFARAQVSYYDIVPPGHPLLNESKTRRFTPSLNGPPADPKKVTDSGIPVFDLAGVRSLVTSKRAGEDIFVVVNSPEDVQGLMDIGIPPDHLIAILKDDTGSDLDAYRNFGIRHLFSDVWRNEGIRSLRQGPYKQLTIVEYAQQSLATALGRPVPAAGLEEGVRMEETESRSAGLEEQGADLSDVVALTFDPAAVRALATVGISKTYVVVTTPKEAGHQIDAGTSPSQLIAILGKQFDENSYRAIDLRINNFVKADTTTAGWQETDVIEPFVGEQPDDQRVIIVTSAETLAFELQQLGVSTPMIEAALEARADMEETLAQMK